MNRWRRNNPSNLNVDYFPPINCSSMAMATSPAGAITHTSLLYPQPVVLISPSRLLSFARGVDVWGSVGSYAVTELSVILGHEGLYTPASSVRPPLFSASCPLYHRILNVFSLTVEWPSRCVRWQSYSTETRRIQRIVEQMDGSKIVAVMAS